MTENNQKINNLVEEILKDKSVKSVEIENIDVGYKNTDDGRRVLVNENANPETHIKITYYRNYPR